MLPERLKQESREAHAALEGAVGLASTIRQHRRQLQVFFGFIEPWENAVRSSPGAGLLEGREKTPFLREDLSNSDFSDAEIDRLPRCDALPELTSIPAVLGSLYVIEGSTLGGQFIARHLERAFGLSEGRGYRYFAGHGAETPRRWQEFRALLQAHSSPAADDVIVGAARQTFSRLHDWFVQSERPVP